MRGLWSVLVVLLVPYTLGTAAQNVPYCEHNVFRFVPFLCACPLNSPEVTLQTLRTTLQEKVLGQSVAMDTILAFLGHNVHNADARDKPLVLHFAGGTGRGKTISAEIVSRALFFVVNNFGMGKGTMLIQGSDYSFTNASDMTSVMTLQEKLKGTIARQLQRCERSLIIIDESEKIHVYFWPMLAALFNSVSLQWQGATIPLRNAIFITTSDLGTDALDEECKRGSDPRLLKAILRDKMMESLPLSRLPLDDRHRVLNKMDAIAPFCPFSNESLVNIARLRLRETQLRWKSRGVDVSWDPCAEIVVARLAREEYPNQGATPIRNIVLELVEGPMFRALWKAEDENRELQSILIVPYAKCSTRREAIVGDGWKFGPCDPSAPVTECPQSKSTGPFVVITRIESEREL